jgi:hypothetical protein
MPRPTGITALAMTASAANPEESRRSIPVRRLVATTYSGVGKTVDRHNHVGANTCLDECTRPPDMSCAQVGAFRQNGRWVHETKLRLPNECTIRPFGLVTIDERNPPAYCPDCRVGTRLKRRRKHAQFRGRLRPTSGGHTGALSRHPMYHRTSKARQRDWQPERQFSAPSKATRVSSNSIAQRCSPQRR